MGIYNTETNGSSYENKWNFIWKQNGVDRPHLYMDDFLLKQKPKDLMSSSSKSQLISELKKFQQLRLQLLKIDIGLCRKKLQLKKCVDPPKKRKMFILLFKKKKRIFNFIFLCHNFVEGFRN